MRAPPPPPIVAGMDLAEARASFPGLAGRAFLDTATVGLAPLQAAEAIRAFVERALLCPERDASTNHIEMDRAREAAVSAGARLLDAREDEIALVESTTHGLNVAAQAIPFEPGDNVVICDLEFLQVAVPWVKMVDAGLLAEVRVARNEGGAVTVESIAAQLDDRTRAVVVSSVQWSNGYLLDLPALAALCRERDVFLVVDAIQQLGAIRLSVRDVAADFVVAGGHKWLNAPFGCGLLYVRRETQPRLRQRSWGYLGLTPPEGGWGRYFATPSITPLRPYEFVDTAKRFELNGTSNYPGAVALAASLRLLEDVGAERAEEQVRALAAQLREGLAETGARVVSRPEPETWSGITTFSVGDSRAEDEAFLQRLLDRRIFVAQRYTEHVGGIRVSTHWSNDAEDVEALLAEARALDRRRLVAKTRG